jgi:acetylornithine/succinyldiaminopimelate/putrescine aminotransferase
MTMQPPRTEFREVVLSLAEIVDADYLEAVCEAHSFLSGEDVRNLRSLATHAVNFLPIGFQSRLLSLLPSVGRKVCRLTPSHTSEGATTVNFRSATKTEMAPLSGLGYYRVGQDGRLYLITKSEHYHTPLGHGFPGYQIIERAKRLGIPNATHNNTRGEITRQLEEELVREANGLAPGDTAALASVYASTGMDVMNRVLNLETGSLAVEAALKMILARFYRAQSDSPSPVYPGRVPVLMVMGNHEGALQANYHGTTVLAQTMRGMWPEFAAAAEEKGLYKVVPIRPNCIEEVREAFQTYEQPPYKIAGFFHEIVMMNYGALLLSREFLQETYRLCKEHDVPTVADEIQSCMWAPRFFLYRDYDIHPTFVAVGKGLTGGEYAASRVLFSAPMDCLPQFGALVTNGQEELASLTYLVSMRWAKANADVTSAVGIHYEERLRDLADRHKNRIVSIDGNRHLCALRFHQIDEAKSFSKRLNELGLDISAQTYKTDCPPSVLTKIPLIAGYEVVDFVIQRMTEVLERR